MSVIAFDTHKFVKRLVEAGMPDRQAEVLAEEQVALIESNLATKRDIQELEAALRHDIKELEAVTRTDIESLRQATRADIAGVKADLRETELRLEAKIEASRADTIKWVLSAIGFQTVVIVGAIVALTRVLQQS